MNSDQREKLLADWLEGNLSEADCGKLLAELEQDQAFQQIASEAWLVHRHLEQSQFPADNFTKQIVTTLRDDQKASEGQDLTRDVIANLQEHQNRKRRQYLLGTIGAIAAAVVISFLLWTTLSDNQPAADGKLAVASILRVDGQVKVNEQVLNQGESLSAGDNLTMDSGLIELVFNGTGVHAVATAPLSLITESTDRIFLESGDIKLHVPPQGIGFVVETAEREITDLGTSFVVSAKPKGSQVFVLDGKIEIGDKDGAASRLMIQGEVASFSQDGEMKLISSEQAQGLPERSNASMPVGPNTLNGTIYGFKDSVEVANHNQLDLISPLFAPMIRSGFQDPTGLEELATGNTFQFTGIAGSYNRFTSRSSLPYQKQNGWMAWYHGKVSPPQPGRYRFWGYADNNLMVAINGKPVFDGSRYDSGLKNIVKVERHNHPAWPCLIANAGFAAGPWVTIGSEPVQLDILFGEIRGTVTSGLLLVEYENAEYETTFWGQPKWPLLLTAQPTDNDRLELEQLRLHLEAKLMGSFSVMDDAIWKVQ